MNVLFFVLEFPPVNTTGNFRSLKYIKYLKDFGINPIIVTLKEEDGARIFGADVDYDLMSEIPEGVPVYRISSDLLKTYSEGKLRHFKNIFFSITDAIAKSLRTNLFSELDNFFYSDQFLWRYRPGCAPDQIFYWRVVQRIFFEPHR